MPDFGNQSSGIGNQSGIIGGLISAAVGPPTGAAVGQTPVSDVPSPADPGGMLIWHSCVIGDYILPPDPTLGSVVVKCKSKAKNDKKKGAGKSKSNTTKQGTDDVKIEIEWEFTADAWNDTPLGPGVNTILSDIGPDGPMGGGPFTFSHPDATMRGVSSIMVDELEEVAWKGYHGSVKLKLSEWTPPNNPSDSNATSTPTSDPSAGNAGKNAGKTGTKSGTKGDPLQPSTNTSAPNADP